MSGVFLSYSRGDRALAEQIIQGLRALGIDVWWDEDMPGVDWQEELERQISGLAGVVVLWTPNSSASKNVRDEARLGLRTEKLVNVLAGAPEPPFPFDRVNGLPLDGWTGREPHRGWMRVVQTIEALIVKAGGAKPGEIMAVLAERDQALRLTRANVEDAEHTFQDAQLHEAESGEAASAASAALVQAEGQLQRMVEMRVSSAVMRTAQQELDDAQTAKTEASQAHRTAKAALSEASRTLARARTALDRLVVEGAPAPSPQSSPAKAPSPAGPIETAEPVEMAEPAPQDSPLPGPPPLAEPVSPPPPKTKPGAMVGPATPSSAPANMAAGITLGVVLVVVLLIGLLVYNSRRNMAAYALAASEAASATASAADAAASGTPDPGINGKWTLPNVSCSHAIKIAIHGDTISIGASKMKIASVDADGTVNAGPDSNRYNIEVSGDSLTVTSPNAEQTSYTRCAG
jgi:hypothetical protein